MSSANGKPVEAFKFFHYNPSKVAAAIFVVLFTLSAILHLSQLARKRRWYFIPFLIGGFMETLGYICRIVSANQTPNWTMGPYVIQTILILIAPAFFAASIYMVLGRIIHLVDGESHSIIRARWLTRIFVIGDVLSFLTQSAGGGMLAQAKTKSQVDMGQNTITAGLGIQILFFGQFLITAGIFHSRILNMPTTRSQTTTIKWQKHLVVLYTASFLILVRSAFRVIEYMMGQDGVLIDHEIYLYIFDATLMLFVMIIFNVFHPSQIITKERLRELDVESHHLKEQRGPNL